MSIEEVGKSIWQTIIDAKDSVTLLILRYMSITMFLGVLLSHLNQLILKKDKIKSVTISYIGCMVAAYYADPLIAHYLKDSPLFLPILIFFAFILKDIIQYITCKTRINEWLFLMEQAVKEAIKKFFKK